MEAAWVRYGGIRSFFGCADGGLELIDILVELKHVFCVAQGDGDRLQRRKAGRVELARRLGLALVEVGLAVLAADGALQQRAVVRGRVDLARRRWRRRGRWR